MEDYAKLHFLGILRNINTQPDRFRWASDNLARLLCGEALSKLPHTMEKIQTPIGEAEGPRLNTSLMVLPIYRAGQALVHAFLEVVPDAAVGSVLIQRDEETAQPHLFYKKLAHPAPEYVIVLDPMLATAGSAVMAVELLKQEGYPVDRIFYTGVIASQEGYDRLASHIPEDHITIAAVDPVLNERKYIVPGLGDYGDRYFGTPQL